VTGDAPRPAARQCQQERAGRAGREQQPEHLRAAEALGDGGEEGDRHREQHRVDVDQVGPDEVLAPARVAPALGDPGEAGRRGVGRRRHRAHPRQRHERDEERRRVDSVGRAEPGAGDQDPAERRPGDLARVAAKALERRRGGQVLVRDQARDHRVERWALEASRRRHPGCDQEQDPDLRLREQRVRDQHERQRQQRRVGDEHEPPAVAGVGERAADERGDQQRRELGEAEQADDERRTGQLVDLERERDERDHRARKRDGLARVQQPELAMAAQRADIDRQRAEAAEHGYRGESVAAAPVRSSSDPDVIARP